MHRLTNFRFATATVIGLLLALLAISSFTAIWNISEMASSTERITRTSLPAIYGVGRGVSILKDLRGKMRAHIVSDTDEEKAKGDKDIVALDKQLNDEFEQLRAYMQSDEEQSKWAEAKRLSAAFLDTWRTSVLPLSRDAERKKEAMKTFLGTGIAAFTAANGSLEALNKIEKTAADNAALETATHGRHSTYVSVAVLLISLCVGIALPAWCFGRLLRGMRSVTELLQSGSRQLDELSTSLVGSSQSLADAASQQMATIEETSAATVELSGASKQNSDSTEKAGTSMSSLATQLDDMGRSLHATTETMTRSRTLTEKMAGIVKAIDEIAFQTNILALNAAVEAARAGTHGQGFAVVADEVRALAGRSADAARETSDLIQAALESTGTGLKNSEQLAEHFGRLQQNTTQAVQLIEGIKLSSGEQARTLQSISAAMRSVEDYAQRTASEANESTSIAGSLQQQATSLHSISQELERLA